MSYEIAKGVTIARTTAKTAKGEATQIAKATGLDGRHAKPLPERELIPVPRVLEADDNHAIGWLSEFTPDSFSLAMLARKERSVQSIDHHNLGLVPADGDDVAQLAMVQALAVRAVAQLKGLNLEDKEERARARAIAVATLDGTTVEELQAELAELQAPRYEYSDRFRKVEYQRSTEAIEQHLADKLQGAEFDEFIELMSKVVITYGEALRERNQVHKRLNAEAMKMVRGQAKFGYRVPADISEMVAEIDNQGNLFETYQVEESVDEKRLAMLSARLQKPMGKNQYQGFRLACNLAGFELVEATDDAPAQLTYSRRWTIAELVAEHGDEFVSTHQASARALFAA